MISTPNPDPIDPTIEVAERQLAMLGEVAQMAMVVSRAHAAAAVAAAHAVEVILADEFWQTETGRARALAGAKDAADAFQKASRALRLTLMLEMKAAERVRDLRNGVAPEDAGATRAVQTPKCSSDGRRPAGSCPTERDRDGDRSEADAERLVDIERPDILPRAPFRETVDTMAADLGAAVDWDGWEMKAPELDPHPPSCGGGGARRPFPASDGGGARPPPPSCETIVLPPRAPSVAAQDKSAAPPPPQGSG